MKIKSDFVTNSSSVNFIVILPSDFKIENYLSIREHANILDSSEVHIDDVIESFDTLMMDGSISSDMYDDCPRAFDYTLRILGELDVIVQKVDTPSGAPFVIVNIEAHVDKIRERLAKFSENQMERISDAVRPLEENNGKTLQSVQSGN